jgi:uncharacterized membrane protein (UPF0127 family)
MTIKKLPIVLTLLGIIGVTLLTLKPKTNYQQKELSINGQKVQIEIADTASKRALGLGNRDSLPENSGMLFVFPNSGKPGIWMKNMRFPIDIVWLQDGVVVDIATNVPPPNGSLDLPTYVPKNDANYVLELKSGESQRLGINEGMRLEVESVISLPTPSLQSEP